MSPPTPWISYNIGYIFPCWTILFWIDFPCLVISLKAEARRSASDEPRITVDSNIDFELCVLYGGKEKKINVTSGKHTY